VLREDVGEWFEFEGGSPYMLMVADVAKHHRRHMSAEEESLFGIDKLNVPRSTIPAVTHVEDNQAQLFRNKYLVTCKFVIIPARVRMNLRWAGRPGILD
jgi:predicted NodU family carbamoyl transferase